MCEVVPHVIRIYIFLIASDFKKAIFMCSFARYVSSEKNQFKVFACFLKGFFSFSEFFIYLKYEFFVS